MSIQVLHNEVAISINDFDAIVADYWGVPVNPKNCARPLIIEKGLSNSEYYELLTHNHDWFNTIGLCVHLSEGKISTIVELRNEYFKWAINSTEFSLSDVIESDLYSRKYYYLLGWLEENNYRIVYTDK